MAVIKVTKGGKSLKKAIDYVAKKAEIVSGVNCPDDRHEALSQMKITKEIYDKTDGRQYKSYVLSFPPQEVNSEKAHRLGREWAERNFPGHEVYVGTHSDRRHIHTHLIVNSVNFENGKKIHLSKNDLEKFKDVNDEICRREGLFVPERGNRMAQGQVRTYDMAKYQLLQRVNNGENVKSYVLDTAIAVNNSLERSGSRLDFIQAMHEQGYKVDWQEHRKNITMTHPDGHKVRMSNLEKTFSEHRFSKERIEFEFQRISKQNKDRQTELRNQSRDTTPKSESISTEQSSISKIEGNQLGQRAGLGEQLAQASLDRIKERLCTIKKRAGQDTQSNVPDNSDTRPQNRNITKYERGFSR